MPGPHGAITVNGKDELYFGINGYTAALTAEATRSTLQPNLESTARLPDTVKGLQNTSRKDSPARPELS